MVLGSSTTAAARRCRLGSSSAAARVDSAASLKVNYLVREESIEVRGSMKGGCAPPSGCAAAEPSGSRAAADTAEK